MTELPLCASASLRLCVELFTLSLVQASASGALIDMRVGTALSQLQASVPVPLGIYDEAVFEHSPLDPLRRTVNSLRAA
jgi:hypothetical protein